MAVWTVLLFGGAIASTYFLVTMLLALIHEDPETVARLRTAGLAVALILMMIGALLRPASMADAPPTPPRPYPPRVPAAPDGRDLANPGLLIERRAGMAEGSGQVRCRLTGYGFFPEPTSERRRIRCLVAGTPWPSSLL